MPRHLAEGMERHPSSPHRTPDHPRAAHGVPPTARRRRKLPPTAVGCSADSRRTADRRDPVHVLRDDTGRWRRVPPTAGLSRRPIDRRPPAHVLAQPPHRRRPQPPTTAPLIDIPLEDELQEVPPLARVHRSRLAFALAITMAALPVIVLDNLPATAEANEAQVEVSSKAADSSSSSEASSSVPDNAVRVSAPTTTAAPATTTTEAPTTTTEAVVQALQAPAPTAPPATAPPTTAPPAPPTTRPYADPNDPATWDRLAQCESGGNWAMNTGNGYYGGLQFSLATWHGVGGAGYPHTATKAEQINRGKILQARAGWDQWPSCAKRLGYY